MKHAWQSTISHLRIIAMAIALAPALVQAATASVCLGLGFNVGDGTEYVPYENENSYSIDPAIELAFFFAKNHRVGAQFMLMNASDGLIFPDLEEQAQKISLNYGYQVWDHVFLGPHGFVKFGKNEYFPFTKIDPTYYGTLRDEYRFGGGGMTLYAEPLKHLSIQCYMEYNRELRHIRRNDIEDKFEGTPVEFESGKSSNWNSGVIFYWKI